MFSQRTKTVLSNLFQGNGFSSEPTAVSTIHGFEISIEKKDGVLLTSKPKDNPDAESKNASEPFYFQVTVDVTGDNPEYPAEEKPFVACFTNAVKGRSGFGMVNGVNYISHGARWTRFEVLEEFNNMNEGIRMGKIVPSHHGVIVRGYYTDEKGKETHMGIGRGWVRKSETETPAWQAAMRSNTFYM